MRLTAVSYYLYGKPETWYSGKPHVIAELWKRNIARARATTNKL